LVALLAGLVSLVEVVEHRLLRERSVRVGAVCISRLRSPAGVLVQLREALLGGLELLFLVFFHRLPPFERLKKKNPATIREAGFCER
jgi:hypothetical protein